MTLDHHCGDTSPEEQENTQEGRKIRGQTFGSRCWLLCFGPTSVVCRKHTRLGRKRRVQPSLIALIGSKGNREGRTEEIAAVLWSIVAATLVLLTRCDFVPSHCLQPVCHCLRNHSGTGAYTRSSSGVALKVHLRSAGRPTTGENENKSPGVRSVYCTFPTMVARAVGVTS